jgi:hypothetical protein
VCSLFDDLCSALRVLALLRFELRSQITYGNGDCSSLSMNRVLIFLNYATCLAALFLAFLALCSTPPKFFPS